MKNLKKSVSNKVRLMLANFFVYQQCIIIANFETLDTSSDECTEGKEMLVSLHFNNTIITFLSEYAPPESRHHNVISTGVLVSDIGLLNTSHILHTKLYK